MMPVRSVRENIIVGLDVGTTKICAVVGEAVKGGLEFRGISTSPSRGLRKGVVVNIEAAVDSIRAAVKAAESSSSAEINSVYVGISGGHIKGFNSYGATGVRGRAVSDIDVARVIDSAKAVYVPLDREVLHVVPTGYAIDGQNGIRDPIGMIGRKLDAKVYILTGAITSVQNLLKCCEEAGVEVSDIVFEPLASAEAVLTDDEKDLGVAVVDIGGGTTDIILYRDGWLRHSSVLAVGGNHFTNDVAVGLRLPVSEAERVKKSLGSVAMGTTDDTEEIRVVQEGKERKIPPSHLFEIIQPRAEELLDLIRAELMASSGYEVASRGVVLTGGGALLKGLDRMAESRLGLPVRIGLPRGVRGSADIMNNPIYATGAGLVLYGYGLEPGRPLSSDTFTGVFGKMKDWVKEIFR